MTSTQALFLGIVQGLTEFLPVSSSGHLVLFQSFLDISTPPLFFDVLVHVGTLLAVLIYFRHQLISFTKTHLPQLIIATVPAIIVGLAIYTTSLEIFTNLYITSLSFLLTSVLLFLTTRVKTTTPVKTTASNSSIKVTPIKALFIGIFQAIAILPGVSRSGSTISAGIFSGLSKNTAFTFSFILSIPAILGALVLNLTDISNLDVTLTLPSLIGFSAALISGLVSLCLLNYVLNRKNLLPFAIYTYLLGSFLLGLSL